LATSEIHLTHKLRISQEECVKRACEAVQYARTLCDNVEFSPEDACRTERKFLIHVLGEVIKAGATTLNVPDTVGVSAHTHSSIIGKHTNERVQCIIIIL
jgi:2-isopropylmalate synthase